jgi:diguanylate cyclase (GGDEF)-like protein
VARESVTSSAFASLLMSGALLAGVVHMAFCVLFFQNGVWPLAWVNVGSVLLYAVVAVLLTRRRLGLAYVLMGLEVTGHAVLAVWSVGWDSGFHYYLMIVVPIVLASTVQDWPGKAALAVTVMLLYAGMDWFWRGEVPQYVLRREVLEHLHLFNLLSTLFILGGLTAIYVRLIDDAERRLNTLATTDHLTGLMNRRSLMDALDREQARRERRPHPMTVMLVDIDHFKQLNDAHGHAVGDWALQAVAGVLKDGVRDMDFVARWGGEEFLVVLPYSAGHESLPVAERLRQGIMAIRHPGALTLNMSATLGVTEALPDEDIEHTIQRADEALYRGKHQGRNQVVASDTPTTP